MKNKLMLGLLIFAFAMSGTFAADKSAANYKSDIWKANAAGDHIKVVAITAECLEVHGNEASKLQEGLKDFPKGNKAQIIAKYGTLNELAQCLITLGMSHIKNDEPYKAREVFQVIINDYSYAQGFTGKWPWPVAKAASDKIKHLEILEEIADKKDVGENFTKGGYKLVWADEFNKDGKPDPKKWKFEEGFKRNREDQWYQADNAICKNGNLVISGRKEVKPNPTFAKDKTWREKRKNIEYTSSSLMTKGLHSWTFGRFVMKGKLAHGIGMWPAWWTLGTKGEWPSNGEIDMLEYYQDSILANVASGKMKQWAPKWATKKIKVDKLTDNKKKWLDEYHVWRMDWCPKYICIYLDDRLVNVTPLSNTINPTSKWGPKQPYHNPQYMLVNLALGGRAGGNIKKAKLPAEFMIDYIRVYQRDEDNNFVPPKSY